MAINRDLAPKLSERLAEATIEGTEIRIILKNHLQDLEKKLGIRIVAARDVAGLLKLALPVSPPATVDTLLFALAREAQFNVGILLYADSDTLRIMSRADALMELSRFLRGE